MPTTSRPPSPEGVPEQAPENTNNPLPAFEIYANPNDGFYVSPDYYSASQMIQSLVNTRTNPNRDRERERANAHANELQARNNNLKNKMRIKEPKKGKESPNLSSDAKCIHCSSFFNMKKEEGLQVRNGSVCGECKNELYSQCHDCENWEINDDIRENIHGYTICESCANSNYVSCEDCGYSVHNDETQEYLGCYYCNSCYDELDRDEDEREDTYRNYSKENNPQFISADTGKIVKSKRIFSAEIECQYPNEDTLRKVSLELLPRAFGVSGDGSVSGNGIEFQTPKLGGKNGEGTIIETCKTLLSKRFKVDKTCGLHVHLDGKDYQDNATALRTLWSFYLVFEPVLLSFLPKSRHTNEYCRKVARDYHLSEVQMANDVDSLERIWYRINNRRDIDRVKSDRHHSTRYCGFNFHSLIANKHLEIRFHSGTLSDRKILEWANLNATIMDVCRNQNIADTLSEIDKIYRLEEKTEAMFKVLQLPKKSCEYFVSRQEKFLVKSDLPEEAMTVPVCAE